MKTLLLRFLNKAGLTLLLATSVMAVSARAQTNKIRIGIYDSRAVTIAYANSRQFNESNKLVRSEYEKAKAANDDKTMKEIDERMKLKQRRLHEQGFSTGSVIPIMETIKDSLPAVAKDSQVDLIVSKWELNYRSAEVETIDITDKLVALFDVSERGLKSIKEIHKHAPLPIEQITEHLD